MPSRAGLGLAGLGSQTLRTTVRSPNANVQENKGPRRPERETANTEQQLLACMIRETAKIERERESMIDPWASPSEASLGVETADRPTVVTDCPARQMLSNKVLPW